MSNLKDSEKNQKEYYNKIAFEYDLHYAGTDAYKYRYSIYESFLKKMMFNDKLVLDAMCGGGQSTMYFKGKGAIVTGVDISEEQCALFKKRFPQCEVICASILKTNLCVNSFDFIITDSLHHLHPYVDNCMSVFYSLLKPGGYLMLWEPSANSIFDSIRKFWYKKDKKYFQENEAAIDLNKLTKDNGNLFLLVKKKYGGNIGYIFILLTMAMRMKNKKNKYFLNVILNIEKFFNYFQNKYFALWFLALFQKKDS